MCLEIVRDQSDDYGAINSSPFFSISHSFALAPTLKPKHTQILYFFCRFFHSSYEQTHTFLAKLKRHVYVSLCVHVCVC